MKNPMQLFIAAAVLILSIFAFSILALSFQVKTLNQTLRITIQLISTLDDGQNTLMEISKIQGTNIHTLTTIASMHGILIQDLLTNQIEKEKRQ